MLLHATETEAQMSLCGKSISSTVSKVWDIHKHIAYLFSFFFYRNIFYLGEIFALCPLIAVRLRWQCIVSLDTTGTVNQEVSFLQLLTWKCEI